MITVLHKKSTNTYLARFWKQGKFVETKNLQDAAIFSLKLKEGQPEISTVTADFDIREIESLNPEDDEVWQFCPIYLELTK